jgi:hypothetical protein
LKQEVRGRMVVPNIMTPNQIIFQDDRINNMINHYYSMGLYQKAVEVLHKVASGNLFNDSEDDIVTKSVILTNTIWGEKYRRVDESPHPPLQDGSI